MLRPNVIKLDKNENMKIKNWILMQTSENTEKFPHLSILLSPWELSQVLGSLIPATCGGGFSVVLCGRHFQHAQSDQISVTVASCWRTHQANRTLGLCSSVLRRPLEAKASQHPRPHSWWCYSLTLQKGQHLPCGLHPSIPLPHASWTHWHRNLVIEYSGPEILN